MAVDAAAVLIMLLAMSIVIRQKGNRGADLAMIPLYFMPAIYLAAGFAARYLRQMARSSRFRSGSSAIWWPC